MPYYSLFILKQNIDIGQDEPGTMFDSMPTALYWAIITMTSVGYGDIHPVSWFGKLVGSGEHNESVTH